jgi:hypothetical protein
MGSTRAPTRRPAASRAASPPGRTEATVFGLDVRASLRLAFLEHSRAAPTGRTLAIRACRSASALPRWPEGANTICSRRRGGGPVDFRIEAHPSAGYLLWGEGAGSYVLSLDGNRLWCAPGDGVAHGWERFLIGQVLPFAALVSGLEIFHASAVVLDGRAIAFVGASGAGKTSLALELCRRGASFLADDVVALESRGGELIAHPGTPLAGIDAASARRMCEAGGPHAAIERSADAGEVLLRMEGAQRPVPLGALFFLERTTLRAERLCFERAADARLLLASTFNFVLDTPTRMSGLLDACALASRRRVERIAIPRGLDAGELAESVLRRLDGKS